MENVMAWRIIQPGEEKNIIILTLFFLFTRSSLSRKLIHTNTFQSRIEAWQQISVSILNLINGNDSSVIHLSWVAFLFLSLAGGWQNELHLARDPVSGCPNAWRLENIYIVSVIRHGTILCLWLLLFLFLTFMSDTMFLNGFLFSFPFLTDNTAPSNWYVQRER